MSPEMQSWGMIILLIVVFYFFMIRPQQKRQKETKKFRESLGKGSKVMTAGGIHGTIVEVNDKSNTVLIEIANGVRIRVELSMIYPSAEDAKADAANPINAEQK
ncbi:MAG: preprotein translocase subunit YajC [Bacteroides sp.]|nr:preprotein translocase subunit YajC [Bacteroides sp.]MCM1378706.1 preprotein translocase subunit YajC [Bacteroides sp.]MCM1444979.1 preprotein translocase subunit YajC [Prevotella sp.]